jgi:hypothetical protein
MESRLLSLVDFFDAVKDCCPEQIVFDCVKDRCHSNDLVHQRRGLNRIKLTFLDERNR